jgi:hypothetical protein
MTRKSLVKITLGLLSLVLILSSMTYAWFVKSNNYLGDLIGSSKVSYFAKGTGTSLDPFVISEANHLFNLSKLQEKGYLQDRIYYFIVADQHTLSPITIDFTAVDVSLVHQLFNPIGDHFYPFIGHFEGNTSTLKNLRIDGSTKQDIGVFGYIGDNATVRNFFIESPIIYSNPTSATPIDTFHPHNEGNINRATGYIVGHLNSSAIIEKIYVISPKIDSSGNQMPNRSQYGLIGYTQADGGVIDGGPRDKYFFSLTADWAFNVFQAARTYYLGQYINSGSLTLTSAIPNNTQLVGTTQTNKVPTNYSISTLKISPTPNNLNAPYLYDQMILDGYNIDQQGSVYSRQNIDVVGGVNITGVEGSRAFSFSKTFDNYPAPSTIVNQVFRPTAFPGSLILYVRPNSNPDNLGTITGDYLGGGGTLAYVAGITGTSYRTSIKLNNLVPFASGQSIMTAANAFVKVYANGDTYTVAPANSIDFDYYVFVLTNSNSNSTSIKSVLFEYSPAILNDSDLEAIKDVDFINSKDDVLLNPTYVNSYLNFGYDMLSGQTMSIQVNRRPKTSDGFDIYITFLINDSSFFYTDFININNKSLSIYVNNSLVFSGNNRVVTLRMNANETVTVNAYT